MKKILFILLCVLSPSIISCSGVDDRISSLSGAVETVSAGGVTMRWTAAGKDLSVTLTARTTGWVAVGFKPTGGMKDANIIMGYVRDGAVYITDGFGIGLATHEIDAIQNIAEKSGNETDGVTTISFKIPLNSGDSRDVILTPGETCRIMLAHGTGDDYTSGHASAPGSVANSGYANIVIPQ